jgi:hypothetical protein
MGVLYPVFVHLYLDMVADNRPDAGTYCHYAYHSLYLVPAGVVADLISLTSSR